jgi:hypothetical protein
MPLSAHAERGHYRPQFSGASSLRRSPRREEPMNEITNLFKTQAPVPTFDQIKI